MFKISLFLCFVTISVHSKELHFLLTMAERKPGESLNEKQSIYGILDALSQRDANISRATYLRNLRCSKIDFEPCLIKSANKAIPLVAKGDPEYHIPKMDPMDLPFVQLISTPMLNMNITDTKVYGLENLKMVDARVQQNMTRVILKGSTLSLKGKYAVDGKIILLPIKGDGDFYLTATNATFNVTSTHSFHRKKRIEYYQMHSTHLDYQFGKIEFHFDNLFNGNKGLAKYLQDLKCSRKKDFEACFVKNANLAIPLVAKGDPDYQIPVLDPLDLPFIQLISSPSLNLNITNIKLFGLPNLRISNIKMIQNVFTIFVKISNLTVTGKYAVDGKIMVMPIKGDGDFTITATNIALKLSSIFDIYQKDGDDYYKNKDVRLDYQLENLKFHFDNLFEGNKQLGEDVNKFLNENWDLVIMDFGPGIANTVANLVGDIYNKFSSQIPLKNYFLDY